MTVRLGDMVAFAQLGIVGLDGQIKLEALRLYGLPEAAPALLCGTPTLPAGRREFAAETTLDLPSLAGGAVHLVDTAMAGARRPRRRLARLLDALDATAWSNNPMRVLARNISGAAFDLGAATLPSAVTKRGAPGACSPHTGRSSRPRTGSSTGLDKHFAEFHGPATVVVRAGTSAEQKRKSGMARARSGGAPHLRAAG